MPIVDSAHVPAKKPRSSLLPFPMMMSPGVVAPALLLPIPVLSLVLALYNSLLRRSAPFKRIIFLLLATLAAIAGASALSVAHGEPLGIVAKVFTQLLHTTLSGITICALSPSSHAPTFLRFPLFLAALLVACELVSALIPTSPLLLPATLALVSRAILLTLAVATPFLFHRRRAVIATELHIEKDPPEDDSSGKTPGRVSSPTLATWPFPRSLALQHQSKHGSQSIPSDLPPSVAACSHHVAKDAHKLDSRIFSLLPLVLVTTQIFATLAAALNITACILVDADTNQPLPLILLVNAACTLLWSFTALAFIHILPVNPRPYTPEKLAVVGYEQGLLRGDSGTFSHGNTVPRAPKPSLSRRESDSIFDFLSLRDPFASLPPPPPPLPPVGLGLDEVDVGWTRNKEIAVQYRFPAPRSIVKGGRRKGKSARAKGNKRLALQNSSRTLLPTSETRGTETGVEKDRGFGDEARLAQLLLQSLSEGGEDSERPNTSAPVPTVQSPQAVHVQQSSRWSASTTVQSVLSASISNRSGVSTYTTCASERVPPSRISMNTIASVLGSRKSSEARRKSATTASSSKG